MMRVPVIGALLIVLAGSTVWAVFAETAERSPPLSACELDNAEPVPEDQPQFTFADSDCDDSRPFETATGHTNKNLDAQFMHGVRSLRQRYSLTGAGITVGVWDGGPVLSNHVELVERISHGDVGESHLGQTFDGVLLAPLHEHAIHVAGTIAASGDIPQAQGMAPEANVVSFVWFNDEDELATAEHRDLSVSNHSYGIDRGWQRGGKPGCAANWTWQGDDANNVDAAFGQYDERARGFDQVVSNNPLLSVFVAAGNERVDSSNPENYRDVVDTRVRFTGAHCVRRDDRWIVSTKSRDVDGGTNGYDSLSGIALAKNVITVGASVDLPRSFRPNTIRETNFSSVGPTDDGRIKPDVIANGDMLYSSYLPERCLRRLSNVCPGVALEASADLKVYAIETGSSMATPVVAGIAALLNELNSRENKRRLYADEMKAVLIQTAISPDREGRPSYRTGWGLVNADRAGAMVAGERGHVRRLRVPRKTDSVVEQSFTWNNKHQALRLTMAWVDLPLDAIPTNLNDRMTTLLNDIDMRVLSPDGDVYHPWSLNPGSPSAPATRATTNRTDNVERIEIPTEHWQDGAWRLVVDTSRIRQDSIDLALAIPGSVTFNDD